MVSRLRRPVLLIRVVLKTKRACSINGMK
jgi:hypothetical protein